LPPVGRSVTVRHDFGLRDHAAASFIPDHLTEPPPAMAGME